MSKAIQILLLEPDEQISEWVRVALNGCGKDCHLAVAPTLAEARASLQQALPDVVFAESNLPDGPGLDLLAQVPAQAKFPLVLIVGENESADLEALTRAGALDYLRRTKCAFQDLPHVVERTLLEWDRKVQWRQIEAGRLRLEKQMQQAQKLESLGVLAGGIAHDFNNLLMGILGNADPKLFDVPQDSRDGERIAAISKAAEQAADLCRQMLAYSGMGQFAMKKTDLNQVVDKVTRLLKASVSKKAVFKQNLGEALPLIEADDVRLRQVIINLITNAAEAIGDKGGELTVSTSLCDCDQAYLDTCYLNESLSPGPCVKLEIRDTGCGMDQKQIVRIFDSFYTTKFPGRGLGLSAVLGIVRGHSGALRVESEPGKGSAFTVLFPCAGEEKEPELSQTPETAPGQETASGLEAVEWRGEGTILVVDDEEIVRDVTSLMLEKMGFAALTANDGAEGVRVFQEHQDEIAAVLLDMSMPQMDGEETLRELRRIKANVRVVMSSGYESRKSGEDIAKLDVDGFLQKPYLLNDLSLMLKKVTTPK
jgi:signal transduction histidine kinase